MSSSGISSRDIWKYIHELLGNSSRYSSGIPREFFKILFSRNRSGTPSAALREFLQEFYRNTCISSSGIPWGSRQEFLGNPSGSLWKLHQNSWRNSQEIPEGIQGVLRHLLQKFPKISFRSFTKISLRVPIELPKFSPGSTGKSSRSLPGIAAGVFWILFSSSSSEIPPRNPWNCLFYFFGDLSRISSKIPLKVPWEFHQESGISPEFLGNSCRSFITLT